MIHLWVRCVIKYRFCHENASYAPNTPRIRLVSHHEIRHQIANRNEWRQQWWWYENAFHIPHDGLMKIYCVRSVMTTISPICIGPFTQLALFLELIRIGVGVWWANINFIQLTHFLDIIDHTDSLSAFNKWRIHPALNGLFWPW